MVGLVDMCLNRWWIVASRTALSMPYLVDGNNLAHSLGLSANGLADREACTAVVGSFCRSQGAQATIVFDGPGRARPHPTSRLQRVNVVFGDGFSADRVILRLLSTARAPGDYIVVTSDKSLGDKARHHGARLERAHEFARRLKRDAGDQGGKPDQDQTPGEIDAWLRVFESR